MPKSRRRGRDELCLPPLHGTQGGAVERPTPGARRGKSGVCASSRQFLLQEDVSSGLSARRLDPRRRRAETGFAAGLNWDGVKRASARVLSKSRFCVSPGPFFLKRIGKLRVVTSHDTTFGADGCPFKHLRLALSEFSEPSQHAQYNNVLLKPRVLRSRGCPRPGS